MNTILKWVGSKSRIMPELVKHLPAGHRLVEPFAGSCSVMMNTDYPEYLVADINPDLINMYRQIKEYPQQFVIIAAQVFSSNISEESYYAIRKEFNEHIGLPLLERAVYFLYLNRNGYRGSCRYNRKGDFNIPFGHYKKVYFPLGEIKAFAEKAQRATFICADFTETLQMVKAGDVIYSDSPYQGTFSDYHTGGFNDDQQSLLAALLTEIAERHPVIVSNSDTTLVKSLYCGFNITRIKAPRSIGVAAGDGKSASEIIAVSTPTDRCFFGYDPASGSGTHASVEVVQ
ncbi:DNA adenine methylase [Erwinia sp. Eh17-17]|uniref:DNA adenine methylase n=1 Tax=Erwinia sp. Eh17-17 TaxID=3080330 RepID=UPI003209DC9C